MSASTTSSQCAPQMLDTCFQSLPSTSSAEVFAELPLRSEYQPPQSTHFKSEENGVKNGGFNSVKPMDNSFANCDRAQDHLGNHRLDNGMSRSSISFKNQGFDVSKPGLIKTSSDMDGSVKSKQQPSTTAKANPELSQLEQSVISALSHNRFAATAIRQGTLEKCKLTENGIKLKKKDWTHAYAYLYSSHLLFYKDQKSAEKMGKIYPAPTDVCDLRGAILSYADKDKQKDKRRKHVISLALTSKTEYLFSCAGNEAEINGWFHALRQTISTLPAIVQTSLSDYEGSLPRCTSNSSMRSKALNTNFKGSPFSKTSLQQSVKSKLKSSGSRDNVHNYSTNTSDKLDQSPIDQRESIIERLLRFFRSRPTMNELKERGIYKPEPVFGSTLSAICAHEKSFIPKFISEVTGLIENKGLDVDGLYRVNGNLSAVQRIRCQIDQDKYEALQTEDDVHVLTGALKLFFRELSEPIFPTSLNKDFMSAIREPNTRQKFKAIDGLLSQLPTVNRETLKCLIAHLERVSTHSGKNRMQIHNLAIMFGPSLFCTDDRPNLRKLSQADKQGTRNTAKNTRKVGDKKSSSDESSSTAGNTEPNQNLAYKMVIYGQIVEFILNEFSKFTIFQISSC